MTALSQGALSRVGFTQGMVLTQTLATQRTESASSPAAIAQSALLLQPWPRLHFEGQFPPQSIPVSPPFWTLSVQADAWHLLFVQTPLKQSALTVQPWPS